MDLAKRVRFRGINLWGLVKGIVIYLPIFGRSVVIVVIIIVIPVVVIVIPVVVIVVPVVVVVVPVTIIIAVVVITIVAVVIWGQGFFCYVSVTLTVLAYVSNPTTTETSSLVA